MIIAITKLLLVTFASATAFGLWRFFQFVHRLLTSPIRHLRGPEGASWIYGSSRDINNDENSALQQEWVKRYGSTLTYRGLFCINRLFTIDPRALNHVLTHSSDYRKPSWLRHNLSRLLGKGVLFVEGAQHRQQRHIMNPAFGLAQVRALTDIFLAKAIQLRDVWSSEIAKDPPRAANGVRLNVMPWLSRMTLDVIGLAGFNYHFNALNVNNKPNELSEAFATVANLREEPNILVILRALLPPLRLLPNDHARKIQVAQHTIARIGKELLSDAKAAAQANGMEKGSGGKSLGGRDLLSLLVKANLATDIPENQRLSDEDVFAQVPTFLSAGHESTSTATTWALFALTNAPESQTKLREELLSVDTETPSMDELMALPYLDAVVKETLRMHPPVPRTVRVAMKDDVLPVAKPFTDKNGVSHDFININKGDWIFIPIQTVNRSQELWGSDAHQFKPERWQNIPEAVSQIPGVWGHQLTFLGGPRACIGYRFALVEMKALLFTLVRAFEFELAVPASNIGIKSTVVQRPTLRSDPRGAPHLPLLLRPYRQA